MEANQLPTKPGPYYWLESDVYEWEHIFVMDPGNGHLYGHDGVVATSLHDWEQDYGAVGQWLPIPTAEELVELQAKAKAYVEGETAACIFCPDGKFVLARINAMLAWDDLEVIKMDIKRDLRKQGYTCSKVRVCKEVGE